MRYATRRRKLAAACAALAYLNVLPASAVDRRDCNSLDPKIRIEGCTATIQKTKNKFFLGGAYNNRAGAYMSQGDFDRAMADYDMAVQLNPTVAAGWLNRGTLWLRKDNFDRAIADHTRAIELDPSLWTSFNNRSADWKGKGEFSRAKDDLDQAIRLAPDEPLPYAQRAETWRLLGDLDQAIADLDKAIAVIPPNTSPTKSPMSLILTYRGDVWRYRGEFDRALADYTEALRYANAYALAYVGRGLTYERLGDPTRARQEFNWALESRTFINDSNKSAQDTARARLAALDSGMQPPSIPVAPRQAANQTSIPTPALATPVVKSVTTTQGRRIALVIGNSAYKNVPALANPQKDAEAVAASLRSIGFETVTLAENATREKLLDGLRAFANDAEKSDWAVVYYAGHGIEVNGQNFLIPIDAALKTDRDVQFEAVPLEQVLASLEGARKLKLVLLDACRDNPFTPQMRETASPDAVASTAGGAVGTRSIGRGLGEVKVQGASLVVFAAKHGQTALDGEGGNSPFAVAMVQRIATPGVEINKIFRLVRDDVMEATAGRQEPYTYGSLPGKEDFFFVVN